VTEPRDTPERRTRFEPQHFGIGRLFPHVSDSIVIADASTERIVLWNERAAALFGYDASEADDLPLHRLVPEDVRDVHRKGIARYQKTGKGELVGGHPTEVVALRKDGTTVPVELTLSAISERAADGGRYVLAIIRDMSDRKAAEEARVQLQRERLRQEQALELNDVIVQGLAVSKMALESGMHDMALESVAGTLARAKSLVADLLSDIAESRGLQPGDLVRDEPAEFGSPSQVEPPRA